MSRRPIGFTVLALALGWLSIGGFVIAGSAGLLDSRPAARLVVVAVGLVYGAGALVAAIGLWRMRSWTIYPIRAWGGAAVLSGGLPVLIVREPPPVWIVLLGVLMVGSLMLLAERYVRRGLAAIPL
jgi:hypothetical protein